MSWTYKQLQTAIAALSPMPATDDLIAAAINAQTVTGTVPTAFTISGEQLMQCIVLSEFTALSAAQQTQVLTFCGMASLPVGSASKFVQPALAALFGSGTTTRANFLALAQAITSPVWSPAVTAGDVQTARAQP
jgi:hypothetical protein